MEAAGTNTCAAGIDSTGTALGPATCPAWSNANSKIGPSPPSSAGCGAIGSAASRACTNMATGAAGSGRARCRMNGTKVSEIDRPAICGPCNSMLGESADASDHATRLATASAAGDGIHCSLASTTSTGSSAGGADGSAQTASSSRGFCSAAGNTISCDVEACTNEVTSQAAGDVSNGAMAKAGDAIDPSDFATMSVWLSIHWAAWDGAIQDSTGAGGSDTHDVAAIVGRATAASCSSVSSSASAACAGMLYASHSIASDAAIHDSTGIAFGGVGASACQSEQSSDTFSDSDASANFSSWPTTAGTLYASDSNASDATIHDSTGTAGTETGNAMGGSMI